MNNFPYFSFPIPYYTLGENIYDKFVRSLLVLHLTFALHLPRWMVLVPSDLFVDSHPLYHEGISFPHSGQQVEPFGCKKDALARPKYNDPSKGVSSSLGEKKLYHSYKRDDEFALLGTDVH